MSHLPPKPPGTAAAVEAPQAPDSGIEPTVFLEALDALHKVSSAPEFIAWTRAHLRRLLPHGALICGVGRIQGRGAVPIAVLADEFPGDYLDAIEAPDGQYHTPTMQRWLVSGEPQLFEAEASAAGTDPEWLRLFLDSGLRNIAAHGVFDVARGYASYFSLHRIPGRLGESHRRTLRLIVPHMHVALLALLRGAPQGDCASGLPTVSESCHPVPPTHAGEAEGGGSQRPADDTLPKLGKAVLSGREREVLHWMREGKTNPEIALILGLSFKTVKNQVQSILVKLRVSNRAQAVAKAIAAGLLAPDSRKPASTMSPAAFEGESLALLQSPRRAKREERGSRILAAPRLRAAPGEPG